MRPRHMDRFRYRLLALLVVCSFLSCSGDPLGPSGTDINGTWIGSTADSNGTRQFRLDLSQTGSDVSGTLDIQKPNQVLGLLGLVSGSMSRSTFTFKWTVPGAGGCSRFGPDCDLVASGTTTVSGRTMTGSYTCSAHCVDLLSSGTVSLTRQ